MAGAFTRILFVPRGTTAPALGDKPVRYEYADLSFARVPHGAQVGGQFGDQPSGGPTAVRTAIR